MATPAEMITEKTRQLVDLHIEGLVTTEELNNIMMRIIEKYEVK